MNPKFLKTLKIKKKRERDPNLPPPPNLFSQAKELRDTKSNLENLEIEFYLMRQRVSYMENHIKRLESSLETLQNWIRTKK